MQDFIDAGNDISFGGTRGITKAEWRENILKPNLNKFFNQAKGIKKPPFQAVGASTGIPSKSRVAINLPETRSQELFTSLKASKPESVSTILNVSPSNFTNRSFIQNHYSKVKKISQETAPAFKSFVEEATGLTADVRVKKFDSFAGKIERYILNNKNPNEISDNLAARVVADSVDGVDVALGNIKGNFQVDEIQNFFQTPTSWGYRGVNTKVRLPNGLITEIQIHTPQSLEIGKKIHPIYEKWRNLDLRKLSEKQKSEYLADMAKSKKISACTMFILVPLFSKLANLLASLEKRAYSGGLAKDFRIKTLLYCKMRAR